ncbi:SusC/RagA family TonB-linked outer membrane protein [Hymenobacter sp. UYP22]|uniref:SusC/RagA family TonB-linked outer membrane protein n=1 Tax=Hymenobacter sp. UYP22 TaxID=3156348 RepID=UPI00339853E7
MIRLYSFGLLLPLSFPALAQQTDTVRLSEVVVPDSVMRVTYRCPTVQYISSYHRILPFLPIQEQLRQVAGVQATPYSGAPGAQVAVRIRGAASLASNAQPLYVVDGVPVFQHTFRPNASNSLGGVVPAEAQELDVNPLLSIPSEDIEQVEVLKGAYETALYGSQGINGVIRITTKRGTSGKPRLRYTGYGGVQQARNRYELLDARELATLANDAEQRYNRPPRYSAAELAALSTGTDWQQEVLRTAAVQEHYVGLTGGTAATRYALGADYLNQQGVVLNSRLRRYSTRAAFTQQIGQRLRLEASGGLAQVEQRVPTTNVVPATLFALPTLPSDFEPATPTTTNPMRLAQTDYQTPTHRRLLLQALAHYDLGGGLALDGRVGLERATLRSRSYQPYFGTPSSSVQGLFTASYRQWVLNPALSFIRRFREDRHAVTARLEAMRQAQYTTSEQADFMVGQPASLSGNVSTVQARQDFYQLTAGYTFDERYQVQATLRRDGASSFAPDNRWAWLPGAQVRWHAARENFWTSAPSTLDVWVGWGRASGAGHYGRNYFQILVPGQGGLVQILPLALPELTRQVDAGVEAGLFNSHLTVTAQAYARRTTSTVHTQGLLTSPRTTQDYLHNTGLELTLQGHWQAGKLQGTSRLAAAVNRNRFETSSITSYFFPYQRTLDGQPISTFYGYRTQGLDATGSPRYENVNGNGQIDPLDRQPLGSGLPRQLVSFSQQLTLGRFEAQLQADGMFGYQMYNTTLQFLDATSGFTNASRRVLDRWTPTHTDTDVPVAGTNLPVFSSYTLQSGNHVRLSALTFSYKVWEKEARNVQIWLGGQNLLVLSKYRGYDPNVSSAGSDNQQAGLDVGAYPVARTFLVGVRATL